MTPDQLRRKYPRFIFEKYGYTRTGNNLEIDYYFTIPPDHNFHHRTTYRFPRTFDTQQLDSLIFNLGLSVMPSYWKLTCSPIIDISNHNQKFTNQQSDFWHKLFIKGMGEYFYKNNIDFTQKNFLEIITDKQNVTSERTREYDFSASQALVPLGGGKDSIVTTQLLKPHLTIIPLVINPTQIMLDVLKVSGISDLITIKNQFDPRLLALNKKGFLNGHVPVSAFYAFTAVLAAFITKTKYVAFSNERSSNESNVLYLGHEINHQYSKTLEFETDLGNYLRSLPLPEISVFSFLRSLYEIQITKIFSGFPNYFRIFSSCNRNFKLSSPSRPARPEDGPHTSNSLWCNHCPKCVSTALMLSCFIDKPQVTAIMGLYPPDLPQNRKIIDELTGNSPVKPFECVLTRDEARAALQFSQTGQTGNLGRILSAWQDNPNLPENFVSILKNSL